MYSFNRYPKGLVILLRIFEVAYVQKVTVSFLKVVFFSNKTYQGWLGLSDS